MDAEDTPTRMAFSWSWSWLLASPVFVASVAVLLLNDHVLKHSHPGAVTGKVSDVAGVMMMAMLATAIFSRPRAACVGVGVAFGLLKTVPAVAVAAVPVLGGRTLTDPTDLIALFALVPLCRWMTTATRPTSTTFLVPLKVVAVMGAALATSATSCLEPGAVDIGVIDDRVYIGTELQDYVSIDGGRTWEVAPIDRADIGYDNAQSACTSDGACFELTEHGVDRVDTDGEQTADFALADGELENLRKNVEDGCSSTDRIFRSIAVVESVGGDETIVVTAGEFGALHRDVSGEWSFVDVGDLQLDDALTNDPSAGKVPTGLFLSVAAISVIVLLVGGIVSGVVSARRGHSSWYSVLQPVLGVALAIMVGLAMVISAGDAFLNRPNGVPLLWLLVVAGLGLGAAGLYALIHSVASTPQDRSNSQTPSEKSAQSDINTR